MPLAPFPGADACILLEGMGESERIPIPHPLGNGLDVHISSLQENPGFLLLCVLDILLRGKTNLDWGW